MQDLHILFLSILHSVSNSLWAININFKSMNIFLENQVYFQLSTLAGVFWNIILLLRDSGKHGSPSPWLLINSWLQMSFSSEFQSRVLPWVSCIEWSCCLRPPGLQKHPCRVRVLKTKVSDPQRTNRSNPGFGSKPSCKEKGICGKERELGLGGDQENLKAEEVWAGQSCRKASCNGNSVSTSHCYLKETPVSASSELTRSVVVWFRDQFCFNFHSAVLSLLTYQDISTFCKDRQKEKGWARLLTAVYNLIFC